MENRSFRKSLAIAVVVLFLGISVIPSVIGDNSSFAKTITVDDDGSADYTKIQDAIDNASEGDTVFVYSGIYYEHIVINTSISLVGEYREIPIIDGNNTGDVLVINANAHNTTIRDFTIQNCSTQRQNPGAVVKIFSNNNTILNNDINNNWADEDYYSYWPTGIQLFNSSYNTISDNIISKNNKYGIEIKSSDCNKIIHNTVIDGCYGIVGGTALPAKHSKNNIISNNLCVNNYHSGIHFIWGEYNEISNNTISNSNIGIESKMYNNIINNTISSCDMAGINIGTGNNIIDNTIDSVINMGMWVEGSSNNITGNKIDSCEFWGGIILFSDNNTAKRNTISNCLLGIFVGSLGNKIIENNIRGNNEIGCSFISPIKSRIWKKYVGGEYEPNYWNANYWGRPYISRKIIFGVKLLFLFPPIYINTVTGYIPILIPIPIPGIAYDNNPAREPYDIP